MSYLGRLVEQSQLHVGNPVDGRSAPSARDERSIGDIERSVPLDVLEVDVLQEADPAIGATPSPDVIATPTAEIKSASFVTSPPPPAVFDRTQDAAPADSSAVSRPSSGRTTLSESTPASSRHVLQEVIEWIAAGSEPLPTPGSKTRAKSSSETITPTPGPKAERNSSALPAPDAADETPPPGAARPMAGRFPTPLANGVMLNKVARNTEILPEIKTREAPVTATQSSQTERTAAFVSQSLTLPPEPGDAHTQLSSRVPLERDLTAGDRTRIDETFEVSIGTISVHMEAPTQAKPAVPPPRVPAVAPQSTAARASGRLQRHYLR